MKLKGADQLIGALKKRANLNDVKNVVKLNGSEMQRKAMRYAPVDTGHLRRSITYQPEDNGFTAHVASTADYAPYQEWGTRFMTGTPHVRPAFYGQRGQFIKDMKRIMR